MGRGRASLLITFDARQPQPVLQLCHVRLALPMGADARAAQVCEEAEPGAARECCAYAAEYCGHDGKEDPGCDGAVFMVRQPGAPCTLLQCAVWELLQRVFGSAGAAVDLLPGDGR
jgi:hypothetical protein